MIRSAAGQNRDFDGADSLGHRIVALSANAESAVPTPDFAATGLWRWCRMDEATATFMYKTVSRAERAALSGGRVSAASLAARESPPFNALEQRVKHPLLLCVALLVAAGCDSPPAEQLLPTVDGDGKLTIPAGHTPGPKTDLSRVDCPQYLAMTPVEMRNEMKALCSQSTTPEERAQNPLCEAQRITDHCERNEKAARS